MNELVNETYGPFLVDPQEGCTVSINIGIGIGIGFPNGGGGSAAVTPLLDEVGSAAWAFSLRKLRDAYSGAAIRVRETGGGTEADIGFTASGALDTTALLAHCGSNSGHVVTWYDQSGNGRNMTQATDSIQPRIVDAGTVETLSSFPAVHHVNETGAGPEYLRLPSTGTPAAATEFVVGQGRDQCILSHSGDSTVQEYHTVLQSGSSSTTLSSSAGTPAWRKNGAAQSPTTRGNLFTLFGSDRHIVTITGLSLTTWAGYETAYNSGALAGYKWQYERVVWASALSSGDIDTVEANMAAYYGITLP